MEMTLKIGDHMLVITERRMDAADETHSATAWIVDNKGAGVVPTEVLVKSEVQAVDLAKDFLAGEPDPNGLFAQFFPQLMP